MSEDYLVLPLLFGVPAEAPPSRTNEGGGSRKPRAFFSTFLNRRSDVGTTSRTRLRNGMYPIEVTLFSDGTFDLILDELGTGSGFWRFDEECGCLSLEARRGFHAIEMRLYGTEVTGPRLKLAFNDRIGAHCLDLKVLSGN